MYLTFKYRIKDATTKKYLDRHARAVNAVWNYCCEVQRKAESYYKAGARNRRWPTHFDLVRLTSSGAAEMGLRSGTINQICKKFAFSRNAARRCPRYRASNGPKRALGWVPFAGRDMQLRENYIVYLKRKYHFWKSRDIISDSVKLGCFTQDARGRWYVCFQCEVADDRSTGTGEIGIDLGLKSLATCSNGDIIPALQHYRRYEATLAAAQRAGKKRRARAIHAKIANARRDQLHKASAKIARENSLIVVGNISAMQLAKTRMAKSAFDASWSMLRNQLCYKASRHKAVFIEADERWTSQTCSCCGTIPVSSPKGMGALGIRRWNCSDCGTSHDRDVNAARNILRVGAERRPPVEGILAKMGAEDIKDVSFCGPSA